MEQGGTPQEEETSRVVERLVHDISRLHECCSYVSKAVMRHLFEIDFQ